MSENNGRDGGETDDEFADVARRDRNDDSIHHPDEISISDSDDDLDVDDYDTKYDMFGCDDKEDVGDWLDEKSLEAFPAKRGKSLLCNACKHLFTEFQPFEQLNLDPLDFDWHLAPAARKFSPNCRFLHDFDTLKDSASRDCAFCKLILARIHRNTCHFEPADPLRIKTSIAFHKSNNLPDLLYTYNCYQPTDRNKTQRTIIHVAFIQEKS